MFDDVDWMDLAASYYGDPDMRALFEALGSDSEDEVAQADEELAPSIMLDGEVFESTAAAVPLLIELVATAHHDRANVLWRLGMCADLDIAHGEGLPMVRAALAAFADRIVPFLDDLSAEVAAAAAYTLAQCADQPVVRAALVARPDQVVAALRNPDAFIGDTTTRTLATFMP